MSNRSTDDLINVPYTVLFEPEFLDEAVQNEQVPNPEMLKVAYAKTYHTSIEGEMEYTRQCYNVPDFLYIELAHCDFKKSVGLNLKFNQNCLMLSIILKGSYLGDQTSLRSGQMLIETKACEVYPVQMLPCNFKCLTIIPHLQELVEYKDEFTELFGLMADADAQLTSGNIFQIMTIGKLKRDIIYHIINYSKKHSHVRNNDLFIGIIQLLRLANGHMKEIRRGIPKSKHELVKYIQEFIEKNIDKCALITVKSIALRFSKNEREISLIFKTVHGDGFGKYLNRVRMEYALKMCLDGAKIKDVAFQLGYSQEESLSRAFLKYYGFHPTDSKDHPGLT